VNKSPTAVERVAEDVSQPERSEEPAGSQRRLKILIADDNRANRRLARTILEKREHAITEVSGGKQVLELVQREPFDIILMDVQMPEMDGLQTTVALRTLVAGHAVTPYIIALTAHAMQGDREKCLVAGMDAYLAKPLRARQLLALVDAVARTEKPTSARSHPFSDVTSHDFSTALARLEGDVDLFVEQVGFFLEDSPILVRDIQTAITSRNQTNLQMALHRMRGLSAVFDAAELVAAASEFEALAQGGDLDRADEALQKLTRAWKQLCTELERVKSQAIRL
jgi:CheY-like chemotaxis protein/HPt (histidine-containing phosphotransfer) domain-containing protein